MAIQSMAHLDSTFTMTHSVPPSVSLFLWLSLSLSLLGRYHTDSGDKEVLATSWEDDSTALGSGREIRFMKPVAVPGLPFARAKKVQRYRRYGNVGLLVCSSTRMEDVPAADTFSVEDCISVRPSLPPLLPSPTHHSTLSVDVVQVKAVGAKEVTVEATFDIKWIKSTFFRRVIEGGTIPDVTRWLETFLVKMTEVSPSNSPTLTNPPPRHRWLPPLPLTPLLPLTKQVLQRR
jgi:hypothetical protein